MNKKTFRLVQYIQPWEIDDFERQMDQLIKSSYFINDDVNIIIDVSMNTNIIDWPQSKISLELFEKKFNYINTKLSYYYTTEFFINDSIGVTDKRRQCILKQSDYTIWLDSDIFFSIYTLPYLINSVSIITENDFILSPQLIKYWDSSWDCLVNEQYIDMPYNHRDFFDVYSLDSTFKESVSLNINNTIKFGGGWFNMFTTTILRKIGIPDEIGAYGPDDTYISECAKMLNIPQYILQNIVVTEIGNKFLVNKDFYKELLSIKINEKEKISNQILYNLINKFYEKNILLYSNKK